MRRAARGLPPIELPPTAWTRVSAAIEAERAAQRTPGRWQRFVLPLAAAAVLVAAVAGDRDVAAGSGALGPAPAARRRSTTRRRRPPSCWGRWRPSSNRPKSISRPRLPGLEVLARDRQALDPQVAADLQKSLLVIDQAIGESRAALKTQPMSTQAQDSLFEAFRSKIVLLQDTISLINEVRKGNQAEAARIADGMNKS